MIASLILVVNLLGLFDGGGGGVKTSPLGQISEFRVSVSLCSGECSQARWEEPGL